MRIFKTKLFSRWAEKEGLTDEILQTAVEELENGLVDADLGGQSTRSVSAWRVVASGAVREP